MTKLEWPFSLTTVLDRGDAAEIVEFLVAEQWPDDSWQNIGDALITVVTEGTASTEGTVSTEEAANPIRTDAVAELVRGYIIRLWQRDWTGDRVLADQLEAFLAGTPLGLQPLHIDLDDLASFREGDLMNGGGRINLHTGEVWPEVAFEPGSDFVETGKDEDEDFEDPDTWLWFESVGSDDGYRDMEVFIDNHSDRSRADLLTRAIEGRGASRRFKNVLDRRPDELQRWYLFSNDRRRGRARDWLDDAGYVALWASLPGAAATTTGRSNG